jgi:PAS domain S-box-containing protein
MMPLAAVVPEAPGDRSAGSDPRAALVVFEDQEVAPEAVARDRRSESRFRNAFDMAPHGMALLDGEGRWRRVNKALSEMLGRPPSALEGRSALSVTHPEDWSRDMAWLDAVQGGETKHFDAEKRYLRPDGSIVWARVTGAWLPARHGAPAEVIAQIADITRRHVAEDSLRASESRFRETFAAAPHGMAIIALDGGFEEVNTALCRVLGREEAELLTLDVAAVSHPEDHNLELEAARRLLAGDARVFSGEKRYLRPDGAVIQAHVSLALARDGAGKPRHFIAHVQDITRQVESETRLHEAIAASEQALLAKTRFLAAASHDLRQPLQALNMFVSVLSGRETDPSKQAILEKVERSLDGLSELMNTLLDISKLEAGAILPDPRPFNIASLIGRLAEEFVPVAEAGGLSLRMRAPAILLDSDPALIEVILRNLIGNALKYTDPGGRILVGVRLRDGGRRLRLDVVDTGHGIPEDQRQLIFEDFHQVRAAGRPSSGGLGLGLGIVSRVARLLGLEVAMESRPGYGSRFSVLIPRHLEATATAAERDAEDAASLDGGMGDAGPVVGADDIVGAHRSRLHMVVVDDEAPIRESLTLLLEGWGHRVSAYAGLSDLTEALLTDALAAPDVLLVDYRLPSGRTGLEAVALTRGHFRAPIPALLLTGDTGSQRLREANRGGLPVLQKPVRPDQLRVKVADLVQARRRELEARP